MSVPFHYRSPESLYRYSQSLEYRYNLLWVLPLSVIWVSKGVKNDSVCIDNVSCRYWQFKGFIAMAIGRSIPNSDKLAAGLQAQQTPAQTDGQSDCLRHSTLQKTIGLDVVRV